MFQIALRPAGPHYRDAHDIVMHMAFHWAMPLQRAPLPARSNGDSVWSGIMVSCQTMGASPLLSRSTAWGWLQNSRCRLLPPNQTAHRGHHQGQFCCGTAALPAPNEQEVDRYLCHATPILVLTAVEVKPFVTCAVNRQQPGRARHRHDGRNLLQNGAKTDPKDTPDGAT